MASRTWLTVALCFLVWYGYMKWFAPMPPKPESATTTASTTTNQQEATTASPTTPTVSGKETFPGEGLIPVVSTSLKNDRVEVGLSAIGGKISQVVLEGYRETIRPDSPRIATINPTAYPDALGAFFSESELTPFASGNYTTKAEPDQVSFSQTAGGVSLEKTYRLDENSYFLDAEFHLTFPKGDRQSWGYMMIPVGGTGLKADAKNPLESWEVVAYQNDSITRKAFEKLDGETVQQGNTSWVSFGNRYFATTVINRSELNPDIVFVKHPDFAGAYLRYPLQLKSGQNDLRFSFRIFSGPKDYSDLLKVPGMKHLLNYGTFSMFAYPLLWLLRFFYGYIHNYGIAIILITLIVRIIFYPLSLKSFRSMRAMQKLQPQIAALKEKHKDDMQKFNQEQMALFKAHNVNPMGGCLPMLVQMPVFFALYAVLQNSIELFHAPFFGWVHDLSAKDPIYIFPILMGISMFIQQKMTPTASMDPAQAKMMMIMPVVFTFIMVNLPSGLTIYIFLSTLMGIVQQLSMNRERKATQLVPASEGRIK